MRRAESTLLILALSFTARAAAPPRGLVLAMHADRDQQDSFVYVLGDRPLSFTTMKLASPSRVVVDFAETGVAAEERELMVADGAIERVALAAAGARTARLVIELSKDAEFAVRAIENRVEVRIPRANAASGHAAADADNGVVAPERPAKALDSPRDGDAADGSAAERAGKGASAALDSADGPGRPDASSEAEKRASLPNVALVGPHGMPDATRDRGGLPEERTRAAQEPAPGKAAASHRKLALEAGRRAITGIGFRPVRGGEVIVRSDHPLEYGIKSDDRAVLLHLPSAAIPLPNNRRPLDTRFFAGAVQRVVPLAVAGGTDVRIELKESAEYQLEQSGSVLTVTFAPSR